MTSLALTTSLGVGGAPAIGAVERAVTAADDRLGRPIHASTDNKDHEGKGGKDKGKGTPVRCGADALIAAITLANARGGAVLDLAEDCTYTLTGDIDDGAGLPAITTPITLNGGKHTTITRAAAADEFRILTVDAGGDLTLNHLTITGGQSTGSGGGILVNTGGALTAKYSTITRNIANINGGGISNNGITAIKHSTISRNTAGNNSGGVRNTGQLTISDAHVDANAAVDFGGIANLSGSSIRIGGSTLTGNTARQSSGAILVGFGAIGEIIDTRITRNTASEVGAVAGGGQLTLKRVTLANNTATTLTAGGLIVGPVGTVVVEDSRIKDNSAGTDGGGVFNQGVLTMRRTTATGNQAGDQGGGIFNPATGTLTLSDTKVVKNIAITDGGGIFNEVGGTVELNTATGTVVAKNRPNNCVNVTGCPD